jgi:DNA-binding MarR family transcriptional regulator
LIVSNNLPPEPDPFTPQEFAAWRGLLRLRETVTRALDERLRVSHGLSLDDYGILITLVGLPDRRLRMSALGEQRMLTPSGITRAVARLEERGLVRREQDPADGRSFFATLTPKGVKELRRAQRAHHAIVRELYLRRLDSRELAQLAKLFEKAVPGVVSSPEWPPTPPR